MGKRLSNKEFNDVIKRVKNFQKTKNIFFGETLFFFLLKAQLKFNPLSQ